MNEAKCLFFHLGLNYIHLRNIRMLVISLLLGILMRKKYLSTGIVKFARLLSFKNTIINSYYVKQEYEMENFHHLRFLSPLATKQNQVELLFISENEQFFQFIPLLSIVYSYNISEYVWKDRVELLVIHHAGFERKASSKA